MTEQATSQLRRRMIEDMTIRKFVAKTQHDYVQRVKDFASLVTSENLCQRQEGVLAMWFCRLTKGAPPCRTRQRSGVYRVHLLS